MLICHVEVSFWCVISNFHFEQLPNDNSKLEINMTIQNDSSIWQFNMAVQHGSSNLDFKVFWIVIWHCHVELFLFNYDLNLLSLIVILNFHFELSCWIVIVGIVILNCHFALSCWCVVLNCGFELSFWHVVLQCHC